MDFRKNINNDNREESAINRALNRLEDVHRSKKEKSQNAKQAANATSALFGSAALPLKQMESIFKASQKSFRVVVDQFDSKLKKDPWSMLGKVAIGCFVLGVVIGHHSHPAKAKVKL